jgi:amino acid adenylation domain-containing protein
MNLIERNDVQDIPEMVLVPATDSQIEILISCILGGDEACRAYNLSVTLNISGQLNRNALEASLQELIDRHEALRSVFTTDASQVCIYSNHQLNLHFEDLSKKDEDDNQAFMADFKKSEVDTVFDLYKGPLHKLSLFKLEDRTHVLIFTAHHIICDGWSMGIFLDELGKLYSAHVKNEPSKLPEANSFANYALDQKKFSQSTDFKQVEKFWEEQYKDSVPVLDLPTDFTRPAVKTNKSDRFDATLDKDLFSDIKAFSNKQGSSVAITLRAVFEILLYKLSGQDDIVLGLPSAGQPITDNPHLMGHCVNLLPIRCHISPEMTFKEYLKERKFATLDAYDHQQFTFGSLLKKLNIPRDPSRSPLVSAVFGLDQGLGGNIQLEGLKCEVFANKRNYETFELFINAAFSEEDFKLECTYNTQLFKVETIKKMMDTFEFLLGTLINDPQIQLKNILVDDQTELLKKIAEWNNTKITYPADKPIYQFISENAEKYPDKTAIKYRNNIISYKELNEKSNQFAHYLIQNQVHRGDIIAVAVDRSIDLVVTLLGILKTRAVYVPIDPEYPAKRIEYMLEDSAAGILISSEKYKGRFAKEGIKEITLEEIFPELIKFPSNEPLVEVKGTDLAYVIYTSGSTGIPKGIAIEHHSLCNFLISMQKEPGISVNDKIIGITTISFDPSVLELYLPLISGAELLIADAEIAKDTRELLDLIRSEKVSIMQATPSTWRMMLQSKWEDRLDLKALIGGEALSKDLAEALLNRCASLWNMYGPTETTVWATVKQIKDIEATISIGHPVANCQIYILDQHLRPVPAGRIGEICIGGTGLARAYLNKPELTAKSFVPNPISPELSSRIYRTGDLGKYLENGELQCLGRIDNQVKIRGFRVELGAVEEVLNAQNMVKESLVIAREDRPGDQRLVAYVIVPETEDNIQHSKQIALWKQGIKELLPAFMVPGDFVILSKFPLLPNGKINRKLLPKPNESLLENKEPTLPETETELLIAEIWKDVLAIESIGVNEDFFDLGGHSLLAVQAVMRLEKETGVKLPITTLFKISVLEEFAKEFDLVKNKLENSEKKIESELQSDKANNQVGSSVGYVPPRTDVESLVAKIWAEHLGLEVVGVYDDFFELGGHSMLALQVLNQLERETGKRLPLASLFDHSTVESMALMLQLDAKSITWDSLVAIKPQGNKMPLYIVHGAGLNVLFFNTLAKNMDPDQPVYGLQAKGLNGIDEPLGKIEDMAAYYISEIVNHNPKGPYAVAGFSFGGIIAFEMAKQFKAMGKEVKMLAMFDTYAYQSDRYDPALTRLFNKTRYLSKQLLYTLTLLKEDPQRTIEYKTEAIKRRFVQLYWKLRYGEQQKQIGFFGYANNIDLKNSEAWEKYVFTPYNGSIELFRAKKRTFYMDDFEYLGWKPFALKGIRIHEIPGEHNYIFAPPNDKEFAKILQRCLDESALKKREF